MENLLVLLILLGVLWGIFFILTAISTAKMAKDLGLKDLYLAYIPFSQQYMQGKVTDTINKNDNEWSLYQVLYPILTVITILGYGFLFVALITFEEPLFTNEFFNNPIVVNSILYMVIFSIISLICLIYLVVLYKCHYIIFKEYEPKYAILYLTLSIFFNIHPILLFLIKDKKTSSFNQILRQEETNVEKIEILSSDDVEIILNSNDVTLNKQESILNSVAKEDIAKNISLMLDEED